MLTQGKDGGLGGAIERGDRVGQWVSVLRGRDDDSEEDTDAWVIGVPDEDIGSTANAGLVEVFARSGQLSTHSYSGGAVAGMRYGAVLSRPGGGPIGLPDMYF